MRAGGRGRIAGHRPWALGDTARDRVVFVHGASALGEGTVGAGAQLASLAQLAGTSLGEGLAIAPLTRMSSMQATALGEGTAVGAMQRVRLIATTALGEALASAAMVRISAMRATALGEGLGAAALGGPRAIAGTSLGEALAAAAITRVRTMAGTALGLGDAAGALDLARIFAEDFAFYWDAERGIVPTKGIAPLFARATSAPTSDMQGRAFDALPNTPRFPWAAIEGRTRPVLHLQPARTENAIALAVDKAHWTAAIPGGRGYGIYLGHLVDYAPAGAAHLLYLGATSGAAPHVRIRYNAGQILAQLHNGGALAGDGVEIAAPAPAQGSFGEILVLFNAQTLELITAQNGTVLGSASAAAPALPANWSAQAIVPNGYDSFPAAARYARIKVAYRESFVRSGTGRLAEIRETELNPVGELI